jgi:hypothetical protein
MRIITDQPELLAIDHLPWRAVLFTLGFLLAMLGLGGVALANGGWAAGLGLIIVGGGSALAALSNVAERCRLTLDRQAGTVTLSRFGYRGRSERRYPLDRLSHAAGQTKLDWMWKPRLHRLVIHLQGGPGLPITEAYSEGDSVAVVARAINRWLAGNTAN